ncbi:EAL domain-containing protein [Shimia ponticola]|uniref:EAL domain-containing protein n=1 Tax=Shimia ponticola TaxID=2582893 RepID=UPI0011BE635E|nr:EAL domain-containing protein [Shimia ponticola]
MAKRPGNRLGEGPVDPLSEAVSQRDRRVVDMVKDALATKRAVLAYQPVVQSTVPNRVTFHEGLVRIMDPAGRPIPARDFMSEVEDTETGRQIDCLALELGLQTLAQEPDVRLAINMSARSIGYAPWMRVLEAGLAQSPLIAERLILEIGERSAMTTPELVTSFMRELQAKGISFALDDFGAGLTSFRYLRDFFFDIAKIDGRFVRDIAQSPENQVVVEALAAVAQLFGMFTVAESVESDEDATVLADMGIDCQQGYHFGAPSLQPPWRSKTKKSA